MPDRRYILAQITRCGLAITLLPFGEFDTINEAVSQFDYLPLQASGDILPVPAGKRVPFGWDFFTLPVSEEGLVLKVEKIPSGHSGSLRLRLMVALDTRDQREVEVSLAGSGKKIGGLSIWYASALQLFECELDADRKRIQEQGLRLRLVHGNEPLYFMATTEQTGSHLLVTNRTQMTPSGSFLGTFCSLRSLHPFGWMEGCTLDGLGALNQSGRFPAAKKALDSHLRLFVPDGKNLVYENPNTQPSDNRFNNLESGLPFVAIVEKDPLHPSIKLFTDFCESRVVNGQIKENTLTTEGCYTLAYPLAVVARAIGNKEWYEYVLIELEERIKYLADEQAVYQRASKDGRIRGYRNWGRGYTWFLLGLVRTATVIREDRAFAKDARLKNIQEAYVHYARLALKHQQPDYSWRAYLDLPETAFDATATAGLGAALLYGKRAGWLPDLPEKRLTDIRQRLEMSLTPDGFLTNCCQINRGGEALQKSDYRVISQYAMGLMAHLYTI